MNWKSMLAYISCSVNQELLLRIEYLTTENRILRNQIKGRLLLTHGERQTLAEIGHRLGQKALKEVANLVKPETILRWHRQMIARKFDGSKNRKYPGRPKTMKEIEDLVLRMAQENRSWGYDRIVGALANLGHIVSDKTVGNILKRNGLAPTPERKKTTSWKEFIRTHQDMLVATDFFTTEVWTLCGLVTYYVLFFIRINSREIHIAGITPNPDQTWMKQIARNMTTADDGFLKPGQRLIHDRDTKYSAAFREMIKSGGVTTLPLLPRSPNLNANAERWVRSIKEECLSRMILFGEKALWRTVGEYEAHYHRERNHQGKGNVIISPSNLLEEGRAGPILRKKRLGGLLNFYYKQAA
ncbi:MAG: IS3 family transposase [Nitrospiria bacterium]